MVRGRKKAGKKQVNSVKKSIDGINFDSGLEAFSYKALKAEGLYGAGKLIYEAKTFEIIEAFEFDGKKYQNIKITPDFVDETNKVVFEIKGRPNESFPMRWKLMKRYFKVNNLNYKVYIGIGSQVKVLEEIVKIKKYYGDLQNININSDSGKKKIKGSINNSVGNPKSFRRNRKSK